MIRRDAYVLRRSVTRFQFTYVWGFGCIETPFYLQEAAARGNWNTLTELHLPAMRACVEESARRAEKETLSYEQYLLELTGRECEARDRNRIARLLKASSLPHEKTLANFDLKRLPVKVGRQLKTLLDGGFPDRKENLLLFGNPGAGKSHLLCALAQELVTQDEVHQLRHAGRGPVGCQA